MIGDNDFTGSRVCYILQYQASLMDGRRSRGRIWCWRTNGRIKGIIDGICTGFGSTETTCKEAEGWFTSMILKPLICRLRGMKGERMEGNGLLRRSSWLHHLVPVKYSVVNKPLANPVRSWYHTLDWHKPPLLYQAFMIAKIASVLLLPLSYISFLREKGLKVRLIAHSSSYPFSPWLHIHTCCFAYSLMSGNRAWSRFPCK